VFDLNFQKILVLAVIALIVFGPERLPKIAAQAGRALRDLRRIAENARADLQEGLGPEFRDFDLNDLHPRNFVKKHLWDEPGGDGNGQAAQFQEARDASGASLSPGESPPYDSEAT
jgi:sec-independent protein translocase protein TatB